MSNFGWVFSDLIEKSPSTWMEATLPLDVALDIVHDDDT